MEPTLTPKEIITRFHANTLQKWTHYEHVIICLDYAMRADNVYILMHTIRCGFLLHRARNPEFNLEKCLEKWHETKTWFWCNLFYELVKNNKTLELEKLIELSDEKGFLHSNFVYQFYSEGELESDKAKTTILQTKRNCFFL